MPFLDPGFSAMAHFLRDEAGASPSEFLLVCSLAIALLGLLVLAFEQGLKLKPA